MRLSLSRGPVQTEELLVDTTGKSAARAARLALPTRITRHSVERCRRQCRQQPQLQQQADGYTTPRRGLKPITLPGHKSIARLLAVRLLKRHPQRPAVYHNHPVEEHAALSD